MKDLRDTLTRYLSSTVLCLALIQLLGLGLPFLVVVVLTQGKALNF